MDGVSARAKRRWLARWWIAQALAVYLLFPLFVCVAFEGELDDYFDVITDDEYLPWMLVTLAVVTLLQWLYLHPVREPSGTRRPVNLFWSVSVGGLVVALSVSALLAGVTGVMRDLGGLDKSFDEPIAWTVIGTFLMTWMVGTPLLAAFVRRSSLPDDGLTRVATVLFAGTVLEILAAVPLDVLARRKEDCVCARGTFWTILFGVAGGVVMLGPAVFLVLLARRRRRWPGGRCLACGADVGEDLRVPRCPACGAGWAE